MATPITKHRRLAAFFRCATVSIVLLASPSVYSHAAKDHDGTKKTFVKQVAADGIEEDCMLVRSGVSLGYTFEANQALRFNLHYHIKSEGKTVYEQGPALAKTHPEGNSYSPSANRVMCLMWENKTAEQVRLEYSHWLYTRAD